MTPSKFWKTNMSHVNSVLLRDALAALEKTAFVGAGDPQMTGEVPPGMDPAAMGGMPPGMDPAAMGGMPPGMDPAAMGGMPPGMGAPPMDPAAMLQPIIADAVQKAVQQAMQQSTAATGAAAKAKLDVATELHQLKMMMGKLLDVMGVPLSASDMFSTPQPPAAAQPAAGPTAADGGGLGRITPIKAAEDTAYEYGQAYEPATFQMESASQFDSTAERARAILLRSDYV
jgi:hypothetical protein